MLYRHTRFPFFQVVLAENKDIAQELVGVLGIAP